MLSYRHGFHAGNHADVLKHATLALVLSALTRKDAALCYIDTHAGAGAYDLSSAMAQKIGEYREGIARVWLRDDAPAAIEPYLAAVRAMNAGPALRRYPGSPAIARALLRPHDRLALNELHPRDHAALAATFAEARRVTVTRLDAAAALKAQVPPRERRGLVLIDPSYELKTDYDATVDMLANAYRRWATGTYLVWYPVLARSAVNRLQRAVAARDVRKTLCVELLLQDENGPPGLKGSGLLVVNPPYQLEEALATVLPWLRDALGTPPAARCALSWLVPE